MGLLVKIVNDFKLNYSCRKLHVSQFLSSAITAINQILRTTKVLYHIFLKRSLFLPGWDFTCSKSAIETIKTIEQDVKYV